MTIFHHRPRTARRAPAIATGIACVLLLAGTSIGLAQDARRPTEAPRSAEQRQADEALVSRAASNLLARTLMRRTRNLAEPNITDYRLTALGLNVAGRAHPDDVELLRNEIEAWTAADDAGRLIDATRRLVRLDPRDTIAQLRLIDTQIGRLNTVEERRQAYARLLGPAGQGLRATVRSRLALDAALLAREDGDDEAFFELLTQATLLDSTNKNAAALFASVMMPYVDSRIERFELIANVLHADPLDTGAYENAAIDLMSSGAYRGAQRFLDRMRDLLGASGEDFMNRAHLTEPSLFNENRVNDYLINTWQTRGPRAVLSFIADAQGHIESRFVSEVQQMRKQGLTQAQMQEILDQTSFPWLPYQLERMRALVLLAQPEAERANLAFTQRPVRRDEFINNPDPYGLNGYSAPPPVTPELRALAREEYPNAEESTITAVAEQRARQRRDINPIHEAVTRFLLSASDTRAQVRASEQLDEQTKQLFDVNLTLESIWLLLATESSTDLAEDRLNSLLEALGEEAIEQSAIDRYRGWIASNRAEFEQARELLTPIAQTDASALYALATVEFKTGNSAKAVELLNDLRLRFPQTALACVADDRIATITGRPTQTPPEIEELNTYALSFAPWLERMTRSPREFMGLTVRPESNQLGPLDELNLVLRLSNTAGRPLAVGPNSPINSRFLFTPRIEIEGQQYIHVIREAVLRQAKRDLGLPLDQPLPQDVAERIEPRVMQQVASATRRLLEVVDIDRVLRLEPNESITVPVWAGRGNAGEIIDRDLTERVEIQWSVAQGFVQTQRLTGSDEQSQGFAAGPMSLSTETDRILRIKLPRVGAGVLTERLSASEGAELARTLLHATSMMSRPGTDADADRSALREALIERASTLPETHLALLILRLNEQGAFNADDDLRRSLRSIVLARLTEATSLDTPPWQLLLTASLISLTRGADDNIVRIARESADPTLSEFGGVLAQIFDQSGFSTSPDELGADPTGQPDDPGFNIDEGLLGTPGLR